MRLLLDENLSPDIAAALSADGHDVVLAADICRGQSDRRIIQIAQNEGRIVISEDNDFGKLAFRDGLFPPGVVRPALDGFDVPSKARKLVDILRSDGAKAIGAVLVVVESQAVRLMVVSASEQSLKPAMLCNQQLQQRLGDRRSALSSLRVFD